jgi:hypothetical protein
VSTFVSWLLNLTGLAVVALLLSLWITVRVGERRVNRWLGGERAVVEAEVADAVALQNTRYDDVPERGDAA